MTRGIHGICRFVALFALSTLAVRCSTDKTGLGGAQDGAMAGHADGVTRDQVTRTDDAVATGGVIGSGGRVSSGGGSGAGSGGAIIVGSGGRTGSGGAIIVGSGGRTGSGGTTTLGSGGRTGSGGATTIETGGTSATGGVKGTGGIGATGGVSGAGGTHATGGVSGTGGIKATGGVTGTGGMNGTGGTQGVDGGRLCPYPSGGSTCCYLDEDCTSSEECIGATCATTGSVKGVCESTPLPNSGDCWQDSDCSALKPTCRGAVVCRCGMNCLVADSAGTCVN
jgi:hypothetical protein